MPKKQLRKQKCLSKQRTIDELQFKIQPKSIVFGRRQCDEFTLYIEKGAHVLGKIEQLIDANSTKYIFSKSHSIAFRIANDKNLTYQWSIYRHTENNQEQYLQSVSFNIRDQYIHYMADLERREQDLYRIFFEKERKLQIQQIWRDLKCDLIHNIAEFQCRFVKLNIDVLFRISIKCDLDDKQQRYQMEKERKRQTRTVNGTRKGSLDSKNKISEMSFYQSKQKISEANDSFTELVQIVKQQQLTESVQFIPQQTQTVQHIRGEQIRITNPEGVDVTDEASRKLPSHEQVASNQDFYRMKKSSILSDIIEESYEGSSNVYSKSIQDERLKSLDEVNEEEEVIPIFSPLIRTQNYDYQRYEGSTDNIKRTTTLAQKASKQYQFQENPKSMPKRPVDFTSAINKNDESTLSVKDMKASSTSRPSLTKKQQNDIIGNIKEKRIKTIKNVIKAFILLLVFLVIINNFHLFNQSEKKIVKVQRRKLNKNKN